MTETQPIMKGGSYFFEDNVHIRVEDTLFCVPKVGLNQPGTTFADMFSLPVGQKDAEGSSMQNPIVLPVGKVDFRMFLSVLYSLPQRWGPQPPMTVESWVGVLNLSTMWKFTEIRAQAIEALTTLLEGSPPSRRIILGKQHKVKAWVEAGYLALVTGELPLFDHRQLVQSGIDYATVCDLLSIRHAISMMDPSTFREPPMIQATERVGECPSCGHYYYPRASGKHCSNRTTAWFILDNQTVCSACFNRQLSPADVFKKFPYARAAEKEGPGLISSTFKEEFEALDRFERDL